MRKILGIVVLCLLLSGNAYAGKYEMEQAAKTIQRNFGVAKGYTITFWNAYTKKPIKKFRCY